MNSIYFIVVAMLVMLATYYMLPVMFSKAKETVIEQASELNETKPNSYQLRSCFIFFSVVVVFYLTGSHSLSLCGFVLIMAVCAYIDKVHQWVPDWLIYVALWYGVVFVLLPLGFENSYLSLFSALTIVVFPLFLNVVEWLRKKRFLIGSGDIYLLPSVGLWIHPQYSLLFCGLAYLISCLMCKARDCKSVPFIPTIFFAFVIYKTVERILPYGNL